jgi:hypothetical protein
MYRPSAVRNGPATGFVGVPVEPVLAGAHGSPWASDRSTARPIAHAPTLSSDRRRRRLPVRSVEGACDRAGNRHRPHRVANAGAGMPSDLSNSGG